MLYRIQLVSTTGQFLCHLGLWRTKRTAILLKREANTAFAELLARGFLAQPVTAVLEPESGTKEDF